MEKWVESAVGFLNGKISKRAAFAEYNIHWDTLNKMLAHTEPPRYPLAQKRS